MSGWMQKILGTAVTTKNTGNLPVEASKKGQVPAHPFKAGPPLPRDLPNASVIYGIGASLLFAAAFSLFLAGNWFSGFLVLIIGGCLVGFAVHLLKHQD